MTKRIGAIGVLAVSVGLLSGCGQAGGAEVSTSGDETVRTINVEVVEVQPQDFAHFIRVVGTVEAQRDVTVSAEEGGVVESLVATKGERVRRGQTLVRIDDDVLSAQLDQAASQAALAEETWQRQKQLWEQDSIGTELAYLQARYNAETAKAQARVLAERVDRTAVRAPVTGILDERLVEIGSMVAPGTPVARVLDVDTVEIVGGVPERYAADIERGSPVRVTVDALAGREYAGSVDFVGTAVEGGSRTFQVEVVVPNPGLGIKPGMVANVQIARQVVEGALVVPRHAVLRQEEGYIVYVARPVGEGWRAEARPVVPGVSRSELVVIRDGLEPGDRVVTVGQQQIADGDAVRITNGATTGPAETPARADGAEGTGGEG